MNRTKGILLVGPTGSGKTPLGELLEREGLWRRRCVHFDFGDRLRRIVADSVPPAQLRAEDVAFLDSVLRSGDLLEKQSFPLAEEILRAFLAERHVGGGDLVVLNGLPRHVDQARDMEGLIDVRAVVELSCTAEVAFERIRTNAGGDRAGRRDDDVDAVRSRLRLFARRTAPLLEHYRRRGVRIETVQVAARTTPQELRDALQRLAG